MKRLIGGIAVLAMIVCSGFAVATDVSEQQWVRASSDGMIKGRVVVPRSQGISAARGAKVTLVDQSGRLGSVPTKSDETGRFTLSNVKPGVYSLLIRGENSFACVAMHVVDSDVPIHSQFEIAAGDLDFTVVRTAMVRYLPPGESTKIEFDPTSNPLAGEPSVSDESVRVSQYEGGLRGRIMRAGLSEHLGAKGSNVMIYQDGEEVARTVTDKTGNFVIEELGPGSYSVLASGRDGFGLKGIELIDPLAVRSAIRLADGDQTLVLQSGSVPNSFSMQVAPLPGAATVISDQAVSERDLGPAVPLDGPVAYDAGGPMSGGGGGGGGGGGIGGGGGGIALLGGLAAAVAIGLGNDNNGVVIAPPVASPVVPAP